MRRKELRPSTSQNFLRLQEWFSGKGSNVVFFPVIYDVKYLMKSCKNLKGRLQEVAEQLELEWTGPQHQAGSDALLIGMAFFKMREMFFGDHIDDAKYYGHLYSLGSGSSYVQNGTGNAYEEEANKHEIGLLF
ncbi:CCR4-NOT transcription complex subunit 7 [Plecturocebus cupreus]